MAGLIRLMTDVDDLADMLDGRLKIETKEAWRAAMKKFQPDQFDCRGACHAGNTLLYLILKEVFWYELPRTLGGLAVGVRRLYLPSGVMNQVSDTKNRVVKA